ncbi:hypothetical protein V5799_033697 [Amblyomma americanum]|uniref:Uncharacterized protein n=1 Tax=Amblyomma americanum TaxID=6943 RepID=A0AAQ4DMK4_AMBAM
MNKVFNAVYWLCHSSCMLASYAIAKTDFNKIVVSGSPETKSEMLILIMKMLILMMANPDTNLETKSEVLILLKKKLIVITANRDSNLETKSEIVILIMKTPIAFMGNPHPNLKTKSKT